MKNATGITPRILALCLFLAALTSDLPAQFRRDEFRLKSHLLKQRVPQEEKGDVVLYEVFVVPASVSYDSTLLAPAVWKPFNVETIALQMTTGAVGAGLASALTMALLSETSGKAGSPGFAASIIIFFVGSAVTAIAVPTGVYLGGEWSGGNGSFASTLFMGLGFCAATLVVVPVPDTNFGILVAAYLVSNLVGSILGYNLSASPVYPPEQLNNSMVPKREAKNDFSFDIVLARF